MMRCVATYLMVAVTAAAAAGCGEFLKRPPLTGPAAPNPPAEAPYLSKVAVARDEGTQAPTAIESALVWSEKYARAVEDLGQEQQRNRRLGEENRKLADEIAALKTELAKAHRELEEANTLLIDARQQNEKWKADVLGFREEMRRANMTELEALAKVLKLLGGELAESPSVAATEPAPPVGRSPTAGEGPADPNRKPQRRGTNGETPK